jgi:ferredoxin-NADP reductase
MRSSLRQLDYRFPFSFLGAGLPIFAVFTSVRANSTRAPSTCTNWRFAKLYFYVFAVIFHILAPARRRGQAPPELDEGTSARAVHSHMRQVVLGEIPGETSQIAKVELRNANGDTLPPFSAGAHLEISIPGEHGAAPLIRHYSLCNSPAEPDRYVVAVARAGISRGGSTAMHQRVHVGMSLSARSPRNNFPLQESAGHFLFIAGGIGITPILSMIRWCEAAGKSWSLLYCARSRQRAAFLEELNVLGNGRVAYHFDEDSPGQLADLEGALRTPLGNEHVYCCGPHSLMRAVQAESANRAPDTVHFEWFSANEAAPSVPDTTESFEILLRSTGTRLRVPPEKSILETLEDNGFNVPFACREGLCRTCEIGLCGGEAEHRDLVLSEEERQGQRSVLVCVSRSKSSVLELDI